MDKQEKVLSISSSLEQEIREHVKKVFELEKEPQERGVVSISDEEEHLEAILLERIQERVKGQGNQAPEIAQEELWEIMKNDEVAKVHHLLTVAAQKGVFYAITLCEAMQDPSLVKKFYIVLVKDGFFQKFPL